MSTKSTIQARQLAWAIHNGLSPDSRGYLPTYEANLHLPLRPRTKAALASGGGGELQDQPATADRPPRPAKMRALHSSSALAVNAFDFWTDRPKDPLWRALSIEGAEDFLFEEEFDTGLPGTPPTIDVAILRANGTVVGIESKFTEWLTKRPKRDEPLKAKYFADGRSRWTELGLPRCQAVAESLRTGAVRYEYLHAAQLLKHCLGLATQRPKARVELVYLFFDAPGDESIVHHRELLDFGAAVAEDIGFSVLTYRELFHRLRLVLTNETARYLDYLAARYFDEEAP